MGLAFLVQWVHAGKQALYSEHWVSYLSQHLSWSPYLSVLKQTHLAITIYVQARYVAGKVIPFQIHVNAPLIQT